MSIPITWRDCFANFWNQLSQNDKIVFRMRVMNNCGVSSSTFYRWRRGQSLLSYLRRKKINHIVTLWA